MKKIIKTFILLIYIIFSMTTFCHAEDNTSKVTATVSASYIATIPSEIKIPPKDSQYDIQLSTNIPSKHKIKIIKHNHGAIFINNIVQENGTIITCARFSSLHIKVKADTNYEIDKIIYNNDDITSSLNNNIITLNSITKDGTIEFKFKTSSKSNKPPIINKIINKTITTTKQLSNLVQTDDLSTKTLYIIFILLLSPLIYIIYYLKRNK